MAEFVNQVVHEEAAERHEQAPGHPAEMDAPRQCFGGPQPQVWDEGSTGHVWANVFGAKRGAMAYIQNEFP